MKDCIFCKIVAEEIPAYKVYEDEATLGFLDISQVVDGHALLIPKKHVRWVWDIEDMGGFYGAAKKIVTKMQEETGEEFVMSLTIGQMVPHAHLHLLPSTTGQLGVVLDAWAEAREARKVTDEKMKELAEKFRV